MVKSSRIDKSAGFTLIELILVIAIVGIAAGITVFRLGTFTYWSEQAFLRRLSETITFLHYQTVADQSFYILDLDFAQNSYSVGVLKSEDSSLAELADLAVEAGSLSLELAATLSPSIGTEQTIIPPPTYPSLAEPVKLPHETRLVRARTMRGIIEKDHAYVFFSPRRFSEFALIQVQLSSGQIVTIKINPFTGNSEIVGEAMDYELDYRSNSTPAL